MTGVLRDRSTGTIVLRERRVVYASAGAAAVTGRSSRDLLGRPFLDFIAPEDRERVGDRHERRLRGEPVPAEYETVLLLPDGGRRAVEALVSLEGTDEVVVQLRDLSDQAERRRRLAGLAELGVVIQRERTEAAILERVREGLHGLGLASVLLRPEAGGIRVAWIRLPAAAEAAVAARMERLTEGYLGPWSAFSRSVWDEGAAFSDDWLLQAAAFLPADHRDEARALAARLGLVRALAVRLDERHGATGYLVAAGEWIRPADLPAMRLFGAQVAAALDSARDITELSHRNFDLAALNRLGELAAAAGGLDELLPQAGEVVRATAGCQAMAVYAADHATRTLRLLHASGAPPEARLHAAQTTFDSPLGAVVTSRRLVVAQLEDQSPAQRAWLERAGFRTFAYVPLVSRSRVLGVMVTAWQTARGAEACRPELLLAMGAHFAAAMEAHDLLGDLRRRVAELTLLNDVAVATATLDPVLLLENALRRICETFGGDGALAFLVEAEALVQKASIGIAAEAAALVARLDLGEGPAGLAVERQQVVADPSPEELGPRCAALRAREGFQAVVAVPLLTKTRAAGALCLARRAARPFAQGEVALLSAIGVQLGVAVAAARQYADTQRRARDLEAINALALRVLGGAPGDARAMLDEACRDVAGALGALQAVVLLLDEDGRTLRLAAAHGQPVPPGLQSLPLERAPLAAEALRTGLPAFAEDGAAGLGPPDAPPMSTLAVPLAARGRSRGLLLVGHAQGRRHAEADLALATALAGELALALENAELYAEARRRLAELSSIIDVARVVSSSLDLDRVLDMGAEHLRQTVAGDGCTILLTDRRGAILRRAAHRGTPLERETVPLDAPSLARDALATRAPAVGRLEAGPGGAPGPAALAVPLLVRDQPLGVALVSAPGGERRFAHGELTRAVAIASQLAVAVDNARLYSETRRRAEELSLLQDVGRSLVATLELPQVLDAGVKNLARIVDAPDAYLLLVDERQGDLAVGAVAGPRSDLLGLRLPLDEVSSLAGLALSRREAVVVEDTGADPRSKAPLRALTGARALLVLPLLVRDTAIGAAVIAETARPRRFTAAEVQRAAAIANQLAVAVDHARAHAQALAALADLKQAQERLLRQERLAALGELSAVVAHEVRNPLGVIFNSLGSIRRLLRPQGDARMLLDIVGEEAERLNRIVGDLLDFARPSLPQLRPEPLDRVVEEAVAAALAGQPAGVEVVREVAAGLPPVPVDARQVRQAVVNLAVNAAQAMPRGGRLTVRVRAEARAAVVELEDTGAGIPDDVRARIFEPFFTTKATGTGLGLAVVKRIVDGHGGEVGVRSRPGAGTTFTLRFPLEAALPAGAVESGPLIG